MYARYIPPAKPKPAPRDEQPAAEERSSGGAGRVPPATGGVNAAPAPPVPSDAFSYARYVPPLAKSRPAEKRKRDGEAEERGGKKVKAADGAAEETPTKRKAEEQRDAVVEDDGAVEAAEIGTASSMTEEESARRKAEKKKKKREERRRKPEEEEEDTATPSKSATTQPDTAESPTPRKTKKSKASQPNGHPSTEPQDSDVEMTAPADESPSEVEETKKTPKKEKKKKKKRDAEEPDEVEESGEVKEKTPKKDRKKKRREAENAEQVEEEPVARHHKAVLDRRDKALRNVQTPASPTPGDTAEPAGGESPPEVPVHGLQPLPQPERVDLDAATPSFDGLPPWIADPVRVEESTRATFASLGIPENVAQALKSKGFADAFAVQTAAIPLLLPTAKQAQGDVLVSAATGSGKTLAYAIPIVRDISLGVVTRMRALVVLPTRELVKQAKEAFESVASAFEGQGRKKVRIGIAYGSQSLKAEQSSLVTREEVYDPAASRAARDEEASTVESSSQPEGAAARNSRPVAGTLPDHIMSFGSTVDILICTPGRLVDHIKQTQGFVLDYVRWLVVDEGDKLLEQNYQNWIPTVMSALRQEPASSSSSSVLGARDFPDSGLSGVRKVFLSATLTSTGSLAAMRELDLQRPRLVMLGGGAKKGADAADHVLPEKLRERAIRLRDENLKPLYLNELLLGPHLRSVDDDDDASSEEERAPSTTTTTPAFKSTALIFTKSNESAIRLSRLLSHLTPSLSPLIATLTSATPPHARRRTLLDFASGALRILVASDLVARGIDLPLLDHVVNYDLPPSVEAYVHRVGRAARAGREGGAWSLVPDGKEGGWFWGEVAKGKKISRAAAVERVVLEEPGEERVEEYQGALEELGKEAAGRKGRE